MTDWCDFMTFCAKPQPLLLGTGRTKSTQSRTPHHMSHSQPHDPYELPPQGAGKPCKSRHTGPTGAGKEVSLPKKAYKSKAETQPPYCWENLDGMCPMHCC